MGGGSASSNSVCAHFFTFSNGFLQKLRAYVMQMVPRLGYHFKEAPLYTSRFLSQHAWLPIQVQQMELSHVDKELIAINDRSDEQFLSSINVRTCML